MWARLISFISKKLIVFTLTWLSEGTPFNICLNSDSKLGGTSALAPMSAMDTTTVLDVFLQQIIVILKGVWICILLRRPSNNWVLLSDMAVYIMVTKATTLLLALVVTTCN